MWTNCWPHGWTVCSRRKRCCWKMALGYERVLVDVERMIDERPPRLRQVARVCHSQATLHACLLDCRTDTSKLLTVCALGQVDCPLKTG